MSNRIADIRRRDFIKIGAMAGLAVLFPQVTACRKENVPGVGNRFSTIVLDDVAGKKVSIPADSAGKIAIIHFWASWCKTCRNEMTHLETVARSYRQKGVVTYSIGIGEKKNTAATYISNLSITYPVLIDPDSSTKKTLGIVGVPTYFVLDGEGIIKFRISGQTDDRKWDQILGALV